jgi:hypothetical protein
VYDSNLTWFQKYCSNLNDYFRRVTLPTIDYSSASSTKLNNSRSSIDSNQQKRVFSRLNEDFIPFIFESYQLFSNHNEELASLAIHVFASLINQNSLDINKNTKSINNDNLLKLITPEMISFLFEFLKSPINGANNNLKEIISIYQTNKHELITKDDQTKIPFDHFNDKQLIICRCLPLLVNILHLSLPDKRLIDLPSLLIKCMSAFETSKRLEIKLELIQSYLTMLSVCSDKAALKIVIISNGIFFNYLLEQLRTIGEIVKSPLKQNDYDLLFHQFIHSTLVLIKSLLEDSPSVEEIFCELQSYNILYDILKDSNCLDDEILILMIEIINELPISDGNKLDLKKRQNNLMNCEDLKNCEMAILLIRLLPFLKENCQLFALTNLTRLCTTSMRNRLKSCEHSLLFYLIDILHHWDRFNLSLIEIIFKTIRTLGRCSINQRDVTTMVTLLQPKKQFPYGIHILRCFVIWSKTTTNIGHNMELFQLDYISKMNESYQTLSNSNLLNETETNTKVNNSKRNTNILSINQSLLVNMMKSTGHGALSDNANQQAKHFFDFQNPNSVILNFF